uniref:SSD domain-containing protein n=1 Tax=Rhabditophanes sp. KR3021 TaxID=114890 RepID=A0AC35UI19_9BILA
MFCGRKASECTIEKWLLFLGTYNEAIGVPFTIQFNLGDNHIRNKKLMVPPKTKPYKCSDYVGEYGDRCTCSDCPAVCENLTPFPRLADNSCKIAAMDCSAAMSITAIGIIGFAVIIIIVFYYVLGKTSDTDSTMNDFKPTPIPMIQNSIGSVDQIASSIEDFLESMSYQFGIICARNPYIVLMFGLMVALFCSSGLLFVRFTTDPVELWSSPGSKAREEKAFFDNNFGPFYRVEQVIVYPKNQKFIKHPNVTNSIGNGYYGPAFNKEFLKEAFRLQLEISNLQGKVNGNVTVTLNDVCYKPMKSTTNAGTKCALMSIFNYFQNNLTLLDKEVEEEFDFYPKDYLNHIFDCVKNPFTMQSTLQLPCFADFGGPIQPYVVLGDFNSTNNYETSKGLVITYLLKNYNEDENNEYSKIWEKEFLRYLKEFYSPTMSISFMAERSIQDEIVRESKADAYTVLCSYVFMFIYVSITLGQFRFSGDNLLSLLIHSKFLLGFAGVLIVALSITSSIGVYAFYGIPASMIILEVQPFLVLAVGVDNIFLFVQTYQRLTPEQLTEPLEVRIAKISKEIIPSMILSSLSEVFCFSFGALSKMPAVKVFSLYAALALFFDFFLQITCFLSLFVIDLKREISGIPEIFCCIKIESEPPKAEGFLHKFFTKYYSKFLLKKFTRGLVIIVFLGWLGTSLAFVDRIKLGLDRKMAVPKDSYVFTHFENMDRFLSVGPPVYFVIKSNVDFSRPDMQNKICTGPGCQKDSLTNQISYAAAWPQNSYIANPGPRSDLFYEYIHDFLEDNPTEKCALGGHAAYSSAVKTTKSGRISASYFMSHHTVLKTSDDFIDAMATARKIADNITKMMNTDLDAHGTVEVFPYSVFYVFYENYEEIVLNAILQLISCVFGIFIVSTILMGLDPWSAMIMVVTITCIIMNLIGLMYFWNIDFNAISVVNLVMSVGISVEFCAHIIRAFSKSTKRTRLERAQESISIVGPSVFTGITMTKFGGICILAFAHSQIFQVYYFRMFFGIVIIGAAHGLIFLPVLLSFIGPPVNLRRLGRDENQLCYNSDIDNQYSKHFLQEKLNRNLMVSHLYS